MSLADVILVAVTTFLWGVLAGGILIERSNRTALDHYRKSKAAALDILDTRKFVGPDVSLRNVGIWSIRGKRLRVTIEEEPA